MTDNRTTALLPCPFCGGEAEICHIRDICRDPQDWYWGKCLSCHISGKHYPTEAEAIAAWNQRHVETCKITASSTDGLTSDNPRIWFELSCGHSFKLDGLEPPNYCMKCGKKVKR